jgi:hypothetical protein
VRTAAAREQLGRHLAHEETEALALAQQVLAPQDWSALLAAFSPGCGASGWPSGTCEPGRRALLSRLRRRVPRR